MNIPLSLYVHIPWCIQKCPYCDFNSHAIKASTKQKDELPETAYINQLLLDLADDVSYYNEKRPLTSIFIGGGTPSLFSGDAIEILLSGINQQLPFSESTEITLEANPGTVDEANFKNYLQAGVNRLSIGVQSFNKEHLRQLGRVHSPEASYRAVKVAQDVGFTNINVDLMFGLPTQCLSQAHDDVTAAIGLGTEHVSYYQLTIEPNTTFAYLPPKLPHDTIIDQQFDNASKCFSESGFGRYEVSAWSRGRRSQHNLNYWQHGDYLGIGAGAHGKITREENCPKIVRTTKPKLPKQYLAGGKIRQERTVPDKDKAFEFMLNALRLTHGFPIKTIQSRGLVSKSTIDSTIIQLQEKGLLTATDTHIIPTELGLRFTNDMVSAFLEV